jgi:hypothetical protein
MNKFQQNTVSTANTEAPLECFVCHKQIADSQWFCRLLQKADGASVPQEARILLCSAICALRYLGDSQPGGNSFEPNYNGYEHSPHIAEGQKPSSAKDGKEEQ